MKQSPLVFGIDLGTTDIKVSFLNHVSNVVGCLEFSSGKTNLPSVVSVDKKSKNCLIGLEGTESNFFVIREWKRLIGRVAHSVSNKEQFPSKLGYSVSNVDGMANIRFHTRNTDDDGIIFDFDPALVACDLLKKVKDKIIETFPNLCGSDIEVVVTVPAKYGYRQKSKTLEAAQLSGLKVLHLIPEPTAAALAFLNSNTFEDGYYMVVDFGGGTLDISLVQLEGKSISVKKVFGDMFLGGCDIDVAIAKHLQTKIDPALEIPLFEQIENPFGEYQDILQFNNVTLKKKAKFLKEELCEGDKLLGDVIEMEVRLKRNSKSMQTVHISMSRSELIDVLNLNFKERFEKVLSNCKDEIGCELTGILLAGGSSKLPTIQEWISAVFDTVPVFRDAHQVQTLVARGAYLAAESIKNGTNNQDNLKVMDEVTATNLGIQIVKTESGELDFSTIIPKYKVLPTIHKRSYCNAYDNQERTTIRVLEGLTEELVDCTELTNLVIDITPRMKGKTSLEISISVDLNGVLDVDIVELDRETNNEHKIKSELSQKWTPEQIEGFLKRKHFCVHGYLQIEQEQLNQIPPSEIVEANTKNEAWEKLVSKGKKIYLLDDDF